MNYVAQLTIKEQTAAYLKNWDNCRYALYEAQNGNTQDVYGRYAENITIP
jgi:GH24 family phage-related lysozyme (muramidase)